MTSSPVPDSRASRHRACSTETVVDDGPFAAFSDPLADMQTTWCESCEEMFPLSDFEWADTGERITDYYARHSARASGWERLLCSRTFLFAMAAVGFLFGAGQAALLFRNSGGLVLGLMTVVGGVAGLLLFGGVREFVITPMIVRRVCGVSDTRLLK